jgi:rifampicin phosphotransferase
VLFRSDPATMAPPTTDPPPTTFQGIPIFPGVVTGLARVILRTDDHEQVRPGEILVAPFTDPAWTPYFVTAAAVVMDQGGILSHGSIVAREYGLPAVTNVGTASKHIRTGDLLRVDGARGQVMILERATASEPGG